MRKFNILATAIISLGAAQTSYAEIFFNEDVIIQGSACIGLDCPPGVIFGDEALLLNSTSPNVIFQDNGPFGTSDSDWSILINDSLFGSGNYFGIQENFARTPFSILGGAPTDSLVVDSVGRVGIGTRAPGRDLTVSSGTIPTFRIEQNESDGNPLQIWEMSADEGAIIFRDNTGFVPLEPFVIRKNAPSNSLYISDHGGIGVGTSNPGEGVAAAFHVKRSDPFFKANIVLEHTSASAKWEIKTNTTTGRLTFKDLNGTTTPLKFEPDAAENLLRIGVLASDTVDIGGNLVVEGDLTVDGQCEEADGACADYVFEEGYELRPLNAVEEFISENGHLPNVPSAKDMMENGVNLAKISGRLLEKIEELTLYTLQQEKTIAEMSKRLEALEQ